MEDIAEVDQERDEHFSFPEINALPSPLIKTEKISVGYDKKVVLKNVNLYINQDDRIALLGKNGNGKSTLVKMLSGRLTPFDGEIFKSSKLRIGYFRQNQAEVLPLEETPTEYIISLVPTMLEKNARSHLARFGLEKDKAITKIKELSGGEKTRLLFASMSLDAPELLIFDEPTNHLDIKGRKALAEAINMYNGAIILISHDFYLLELVADTLWLVDNHTCSIYDGSLKDYRDFLLKKDIKKEEKKTSPKEGVVSKNNKESRKDRAKIREIEKMIKQKEDAKSKILEEFSFVQDGKRIVALQKELKDIENDINALECEWFELQEYN
jgi:ATP-binding cassette subfamily F protein 3